MSPSFHRSSPTPTPDIPERPSSLHPVQASSEIPELARPVRDHQTGGRVPNSIKGILAGPPPKATFPPQEIAGLMIRVYENPLVSLNKAENLPLIPVGG